jgi:hypothetical protein
MAERLRMTEKRVPAAANPFRGDHIAGPKLNQKSQRK